MLAGLNTLEMYRDNLLVIIFVFLKLYCSSVISFKSGQSGQTCPGLSDQTCGSIYHFPFDDVSNEQHTCGRPADLIPYPEGWSTPGDWTPQIHRLYNATAAVSSASSMPRIVKRITGVSGHALYLDGSEKRPLYLEMSESQCLAGVESCPDGFTFAFWIKPFFDVQRGSKISYTSSRNRDVILAVNRGINAKLGAFSIRRKIYKKGKTRDMLLFSLRTTRTTFYRGRLSTTVLKHQIKIRRALLPDDMWTHVTVRWNMSLRRTERLVVFINKERVKGKVDTNRRRTGRRPPPSVSHLTKLYIGSLGTSGDIGPGVRMAMDDLQIWQKPLETEEILTLPIYPGCPACWRQHNGRCYKFSGEPRNYASAEVDCKLHGGNLANVVESDILNVVTRLLTPKGSPPSWVSGGEYQTEEDENDKSTFHIQEAEEYDYGYNENDEQYEEGVNAAPFRSIPDSYIGWKVIQHKNGEDANKEPESYITDSRGDGNNSPENLVMSDKFPAVDLVQDDYDDIIDSSYEYVLNDAANLIQSQRKHVETCYVASIENVVREKCDQIRPYICETGINECRLNTHSCGHYQCTDLRSSYTCECPSGSQWNGQTCQGTRNKDDYCRIVTMFSRLLPTGFCSRPHFLAVCPEECKLFRKKRSKR